MKKSHIVMILLVAVVSAILVSTFVSAMSSGTFSEAAAAPNEKIKITGTFDKSQPVEYDKLTDANLTAFHMVDSKGVSHKVFLHDDKGRPMGLEQSESLTIEGKMLDNGEFHASHLLMKCPSKYNDQKHSLETASK